jgi:hypothetical protein
MKKILSLFVILIFLTSSAFATQSTIVTPDGTGAAVRAGVNNAIMTAITNDENTSAPAITYSGMDWYDSGTMTVWERNVANTAWIKIGTLDATNWGLVPQSAVSTTPSAGIIPQANSSGLLPFSITGNASTATTTTGNSATASNASLLQGLTASQVAALANSISAQSLSGNGYVKFTNGLIIQWGSTTATPVTFPVTFPSSCFTVVCTPTAAITGMITSISTTGFSYGGNGYTYYWIAIGI